MQCPMPLDTDCVGLKTLPEGPWSCSHCNMDSTAFTDLSAQSTGDTFLSLAKSIDLDFAVPRGPDAAQAGTRWIAQNQSGVAFSLRCDCKWVLVPTLTTDQAAPTHEIIRCQATSTWIHAGETRCSIISRRNTQHCLSQFLQLARSTIYRRYGSLLHLRIVLTRSQFKIAIQAGRLPPTMRLYDRCSAYAGRTGRS